MTTALLLFALPLCICGSQFTFKLPNNKVTCFYENLDRGTDVNVQFQVVEGGNFDCNVEVKSPDGKSLYKDIKKQYDSFTWTAGVSGPYQICFSNEFSTFTHKVVYFDIRVETFQPQPSPLSMVAVSLAYLNANMQVVEDYYQTHERFKEARGRTHSEDLNMKVLVGGAVYVTLVVLAALLQCCLLRLFFADLKNSFVCKSSVGTESVVYTLLTDNAGDLRDNLTAVEQKPLVTLPDGEMKSKVGEPVIAGKRMDDYIVLNGDRNKYLTMITSSADGDCETDSLLRKSTEEG